MQNKRKFPVNIKLSSSMFLLHLIVLFMMLYPPAINDDGVIEGSESEEEKEIDDQVKVKKKTKNKRYSTDFNTSFTFNVSNTLNKEEIDDLQGIRQYLKKNVKSTLQEKIDRERSTLTLNEIKNEEEQNENEIEDGIVQEMDEIEDKVRSKKSKPKRSNTKDEFFDKEMSNQMMKKHSLTFSQMSLSRPILKSITACGFDEPTPIQNACIPVALAGRDICACAATGTGKTAAFVLPIIERLLFKPKRKSVTRVIILVPTRELAIQVFQVFRQLSQFAKIDICLCAGGLDLKAQEAALRLGPDVVIATPGRLIDHLHNAPNFSLHSVEVLVLDEADRMLDEAFAEQMKEIIRLCSVNRQTMLFSATMTDEIEDLAAVSLKNPVRLFINENTETAMNLRQEFIRIRKNREEDRESIVVALICRTFTDHTILFVQTKKLCQRMNIILGLLGVKVGQLHGNLTQTQRIETLSKFRKAELDVLVSTDLASRGLDIEGVLTIVNMNMPKTLKQYVHRVGRTARAGRAGRSITLVGEDERKLLKEILKANKSNAALKQRIIDPEVISAYHERIIALEESIKKIEEEEVSERSMRLAEQELEKGEKILEGKKEKRNWMTKEGASKKADRTKKVEQTLDPEQVRLQRTSEFHIREAKRARKAKRIRAINEDDEEPRRNDKNSNNKKRKRTSTSFTQELTSITKKSIKRFRYGPSDADFRKAKRAKVKGRRK